MAFHEHLKQGSPLALVQSLHTTCLGCAPQKVRDKQHNIASCSSVQSTVAEKTISQYDLLVLTGILVHRVDGMKHKAHVRLKQRHDKDSHGCISLRNASSSPGQYCTASVER